MASPVWGTMHVKIKVPAENPELSTFSLYKPWEGQNRDLHAVKFFPSYFNHYFCCILFLQLGAWDAEISPICWEHRAERFSFKAWSRSVYSHTIMPRLLPGISSLLISTLPAHSPVFSHNLSGFFPVLAVANTGTCVACRIKSVTLLIVTDSWCRFPC